jgi:surface antigen
MKNWLLIAVAALSLSACTTTQKTAAVGATAGFIAGGAGTGTLTGAAVGAGVGAVAGAVAGELLGKDSNDSQYCYYKDRYGNIFRDVCPKG